MEGDKYVVNIDGQEHALTKEYLKSKISSVQQSPESINEKVSNLKEGARITDNQGREHEVTHVEGDIVFVKKVNEDGSLSEDENYFSRNNPERLKQIQRISPAKTVEKPWVEDEKETSSFTETPELAFDVMSEDLQLKLNEIMADDPSSIVENLQEKYLNPDNFSDLLDIRSELSEAVASLESLKPAFRPDDYENGLAAMKDMLSKLEEAQKRFVKEGANTYYERLLSTEKLAGSFDENLKEEIGRQSRILMTLQKDIGNITPRQLSQALGFRDKWENASPEEKERMIEAEKQLRKTYINDLETIISKSPEAEKKVEAQEAVKEPEKAEDQFEKARSVSPEKMKLLKKMGNLKEGDEIVNKKTESIYKVQGVYGQFIFVNVYKEGEFYKEAHFSKKQLKAKIDDISEIRSQALHKRIGKKLGGLFKRKEAG